MKNERSCLSYAVSCPAHRRMRTKMCELQAMRCELKKLDHIKDHVLDVVVDRILDELNLPEDTRDEAVDRAHGVQIRLSRDTLESTIENQSMIPVGV